jgi:hypothetical protein
LREMLFKRILNYSANTVGGKESIFPVTASCVAMNARNFKCVVIVILLL